MRVRCTDIDRPAPEGIWSLHSYADEEQETERERIESLFHCHRPHRPSRCLSRR